MRCGRPELPEFGIERSQMVTGFERTGICLGRLLERRQTFRGTAFLHIQHAERSQHLGPPREFPPEFFQPSNSLLEFSEPAE